MRLIDSKQELFGYNFGVILKKKSKEKKLFKLLTLQESKGRSDIQNQVLNCL